MIKVLKKNTLESNLKMAFIYRRLSEMSTELGDLKKAIKYSLKNIRYLKSVLG